MLESVIISIDGRVDLVDNILEFLRGRDNTTIDYVNSQKFSDGELCVDFKTQ
jgi:hypothetical protein